MIATSGDLVTQCIRMRDRLVEVLVSGESLPTKGLLRSLSQLSPTVDALAVSGLPSLLKLPELQAKFDTTSLALARAILDQWRRQRNDHTAWSHGHTAWSNGQTCVPAAWSHGHTVKRSNFARKRLTI